MAVLLDTGFYLGLVHPADENALRAGEILKELSTGKYGLLYSTNLVFSEVTTLVYIRTNGNKGVLNNLEEILSIALFKCTYCSRIPSQRFKAFKLWHEDLFDWGYYFKVFIHLVEPYNSFHPCLSMRCCLKFPTAKVSWQCGHGMMGASSDSSRSSPLTCISISQS
ncbi:hypothetical protein LCGC14_1110100 [marine sediment metagenome]|uniref:PIN domain-containing protein n=1 Tax=marine sediment metagenome TaxID=412755 RepID=A0A0F9PQ37_9ZZZZ